MCWKWHQYCWTVVDCTYGLLVYVALVRRMTGWFPGIMLSTLLWTSQHHLGQTVEQSVAACFQRIQSPQKGWGGFIRGAISQETKGRVLFLRTAWLELNDLPWHVSSLVFAPHAVPRSTSRPGMLALALGVWDGCLYVQTGELHHGKHCNLLRSCCGKRGKWGNLLWIYLSRASASGSRSHLLLFAHWNLTLACLQLIYCFVKYLLFLQRCLHFSDTWNDPDDMGLIHRDTCNQS